MDYGEPISYLTLASGTDVFSSDGERVGKVEHVLADESTAIFDGLVIDIKRGPGGWRFVDAEVADRLYERAVVLHTAAADVQHLPKPTPAPAVMENHGVEDSQGPLAGKLSRAWDLLSGNR